MTRLAWLKLSFCWLLVALVLGWPARNASAQTPSADAPAHISFVDGAALLERDGRAETAPASMPLLAGDRVRTQGGRVEVLFADGSTLHLDAQTVVDFQSDEVIRLLEGRVRLNIPGPSRDVAYRIDAPSGWIQITEPGEFRVSLLTTDRQPELELAVLRGTAELVNEDGRTPLRAGERAFVRAGAAPSYAYVFNSAAWDAFDQWSEARRNERLGAYAEYLPSEVRPYGATLARHGTWRREPTYGHVWYPTVHPGWRPYYYGRWTSLRPFGWTWIGHDPWAWPTHHFGRWGFSAGLWFWIPGRHWGPAWVSWAYAPGFVSWCPLGWNNRPVFSFINVNVFGGRRFDRWHAWTVVPHRRFGGGFVHTNVVNVTHINVRTRNAFVVRETAPDVRGYAVPRSEAPIRVAGTRGGIAVPRGGAVAGGSSSRSVDTPRAGASDRGAALRNRLAAEPQRGQGFPAPSREPRPASPLRQATPREGSPAVRGAGGAAASESERRPDSASVPNDRGAARRAVPRSSPDAVPIPQTSAPPRAGAPQSERRPSNAPRAVPGAAGPPQSSAPARRAVPPSDRVPRGGSPPPAVQRTPPPSAPEYYRGSRREAPALSSQPEAQPGIRRMPSPAERSPSGGARSAPPQGRSSGEAPAYRAPSAGRRGPPAASAPSGPAPSAPAASAPARGGRPSAPSASPPSGSNSRGGAAPSRSRGGQQPRGSARPRGGER